MIITRIVTMSKVLLAAFAVFICLWGVGRALNVEQHPYDRCMLEFVQPEKQIECVWRLGHERP